MLFYLNSFTTDPLIPPFSLTILNRVSNLSRAKIFFNDIFQLLKFLLIQPRFLLTLNLFNFEVIFIYFFVPTQMLTADRPWGKPHSKVNFSTDLNKLITYKHRVTHRQTANVYEANIHYIICTLLIDSQS